MIIIYYNVIDMDIIGNNDIIRINVGNRNYDYNDKNRSKIIAIRNCGYD